MGVSTIYVQLSRILIAFIIILIPNIARADYLEELYPHYYPPGSLIIRYGGPQASIKNYISDYLEDIWRDTYRIKYESGAIEYEEYNSNILSIDYKMHNSGRVGNWWEKKWHEYITDCSPTSFYNIGITRTIINSPAFYITNEFEFRFKSLEITIDGAEPSVQRFSGNGWRLIVNPDIKFGTSYYMDSVWDFVKSISVQFIIKKFYYFKNYLDIKLDFNYYTETKEYEMGFNIALPLWS